MALFRSSRVECPSSAIQTSGGICTWPALGNRFSWVLLAGCERGNEVQGRGSWVSEVTTSQRTWICVVVFCWGSTRDVLSDLDLLVLLLVLEEEGMRLGQNR